jgi:hypothetical protein
MDSYGFIAPKVLYASNVWHADAHTNHIKLPRLSRLALVQLSPCCLHTPSAGLEVITGTVPLHLRAHEKNLFTFIHLMDYNIETYRRGPGHLARLYEDVQAIGLAAFPIDKVPPRPFPPPPFDICLPFDHPPPMLTPTPSIPRIGDHVYAGSFRSLIIYTDVSKVDTPTQWGSGGSYVFFLSENADLHPPPGAAPICSVYFTACHAKSVYLMEVMAVTAAVRQYHALINQDILRPV